MAATKPYEYGKIAAALFKGNVELAAWLLKGGVCDYAKKAKLCRRPL